MAYTDHILGWVIYDSLLRRIGKCYNSSQQIIIVGLNVLFLLLILILILVKGSKFVLPGQLHCLWIYLIYRNESNY